MLPVVIVVSIVVSAIYLGWATPTEAGALGSFVVFALALWRRTKWRTLKDALMETAKLTVMIFRITSYNVCYTKLLRPGILYFYTVSRTLASPAPAGRPIPHLTPSGPT